MAAPILSHLRAILRVIGNRSHRLWRRFRALRPRYQLIIAILLVVGILALGAMLSGGNKSAATPLLRTVALETVSTLSGTGTGAGALGSVRSVTEAEILAETGGTVRSVNTSVGRSIAAGSVIAELENSAERATVLQAEGAYDAALATQASVSLVDVALTARNAYRDAFMTLDTALENEIDLFFGGPTAAGPDLLINPAGTNPTTLSRERAAVEQTMNRWGEDLADASTRDPETLLNEAEVNARMIQSFSERLAEAANKTDSRATSTQLAALASARATISGVLSSLSSARIAYRSGSLTSTASVDAGVKSALGTLRLAQASLERTVVRAPIAGTVNFLPIRVGDYVTTLMHVATVAQNGALEIVVFVSEENRQALSVGAAVRIEGRYDGIVTSIAPALDPLTKQIEVHVAVKEATSLVNGQAVHIELPGIAVSPTTSGPLLLPLTAVKLSADARVLFTVVEGRLIAIPVEIGDVRGDRIEVSTPLPTDLRVVVDARGLSEGQAVMIAERE